MFEGTSARLAVLCCRENLGRHTLRKDSILDRPDVPAKGAKLASVLYNSMEQGQPNPQAPPLSWLRTLVQVCFAEAGVCA